MNQGVLATDPAALRSAAASLRGISYALEECSLDVGGSGDASWRGLAALEAAARRQETAALLRALAGPVTDAAAGLDLVATVAEDTGGRVRRHLRELDDVLHERTILLSTGPPVDGLGAAQWHARLAALEETAAAVDALVARARTEFADVQRAVAATVERALGPDLYALLGSLAFVHQTGRYVTRAGAGARAAGTALSALHRVRRMRVPGGERTLHVVSSRVREAAERLGKKPPGWLTRVPRVGAPAAAVAARGVPLLLVPDAVTKTVTGGGYGGVRGGLTRALAGGAVVGVGAAVVLTAPAAATAGVLAAGAYTAWMTGNYVWDDRRRLGRITGRSWSAARGGAARGLSAAGDLTERARERARSGLRRLRQRWSLPAAAQPPAGAVP